MVAKLSIWSCVVNIIVSTVQELGLCVIRGLTRLVAAGAIFFTTLGRCAVKQVLKTSKKTAVRPVSFLFILSILIVCLL